MRAKLDDRYGRLSGTGRRDRRVRFTAVAAGVLGVSMALGYLLWVALSAATPAVSSALIGYDVRNASSVEVRIEVRRDPTYDVQCLLRAQDVDNVTVGRLALEVPRGGDRTVALAAVVPTTRLAINGELEECRVVDRG